MSQYFQTMHKNMVEKKNKKDNYYKQNQMDKVILSNIY